MLSPCPFIQRQACGLVWAYESESQDLDRTNSKGFSLPLDSKGFGVKSGTIAAKDKLRAAKDPLLPENEFYITKGIRGRQSKTGSLVVLFQLPNQPDLKPELPLDFAAQRVTFSNIFVIKGH